MIIRIILAIAIGCTTTSSSSAQSESKDEKKNKVILMGMIHRGHTSSTRYDLEKVKSLIRKIKPDYVYCEIPPDRLKLANKQYRETGAISESRVKVFPEYVDALYPLTKELEFEIVPCAGWTKAMADARKKKLEELKTSEADKYKEMSAAQEKADETIKKEGGDDNPEFIHTDRYDEIVRIGMTPYDRHFNEILGPGGWENINKSHFGLIAKNLDAHRNQGKTVLIMFGAWHKYWFKEQLKKRKDVELVSLSKYLENQK